MKLEDQEGPFQMNNPLFYLRVYFGPFLNPLKLILDLKQLSIPNSDIFFVASPADVQTPSGSLYIPDKLQGIIEIVEKRHLSYSKFFHLFSKRSKYENKSSFIRLELLFILHTLANPIRFYSRLGIIFKRTHELGKVTSRQKIRFVYWSLVFLEKKPKVVFAIGFDQILIASAKLQGIKTVEVMHGLFAQGQSPFSFETDTDLKKPDLFLSWHDDFTAIVNNLGVPAETLGYPNTFPRELKSLTREVRKSGIFVTLSWGLAASADPFGTFNHEMYLYLRDFRTEDLIFRIHPVACQTRRQTLRITKWLVQEFPGCHVSIPYQERLLNALSDSLLHITYESSTFFEAGLVGVPTLFFNTSGNQDVYIPEELINNGLVFFNKEFVATQQGRITSADGIRFLEADLKEEKVVRILNQAKLIT